MQTSTYTQCELARPVGRQVQKDTRWIPTTLAKLGKPVRVKATGETWFVTEVGEIWPEKRVLAYERDFVMMATVSDAFSDGHGGRRLPVRPK